MKTIPVNDTPASEATRLLSKDEGVESIGSESKENTPDKDLSRAIGVLSFSLLIQSYLLVSVFPYSGFLAMHLIPGLNEETAGSYAGLIASSFMAGRALSSFEWGKAADRYGRAFVIEVSLLLSAAFSILFGLAPTFPMALALRFLLGMCNGLLGPIKTMVSEYARGDQEKETKWMAIVIGMWGYGFLINPAISGYLSDPVKQYPDADFVRLLHPVLEAFPFLLPNIVGCCFCLVGYLLVHNFVEETLPEEKRQQFQLPSILPCMKSNHPMMRNVSSWGLFKHLHNSDGDKSEELNAILSSPKAKNRRQSEKSDEGSATISSLLKRKSTRQHMLIYWIYSFLIVAVDEVFPLYCISKSSGLGITEKVIGKILSWSGLFFICIQFFLITGLVGRFGFYKSLRIGALFSIPLAGYFPVALITNRGAPDGSLTFATLLFISALYGCIRSFSSVVFSVITMTLNRTVPENQRASMNGLSMLGGSFTKALGPLFGGVLFSTSVNNVTPPFGSVVVYSTISLLGIGLCIQAYFLREYDGHKSDSAKVTEDESMSSDGDIDEEEPPHF